MQNKHSNTATRCDYCGGAARRQRKPKFKGAKHNAKRWECWRCTQCGMEFFLPRHALETSPRVLEKAAIQFKTFVPETFTCFWNGCGERAEFQLLLGVGVVRARVFLCREHAAMGDGEICGHFIGNVAGNKERDKQEREARDAAI